MVGPSRADGQAEGHRLKGSRIVTGQLHPLDVDRSEEGLAADPLGRSTASQSEQQTPRPLASDGQVDCLDQRLAVAERERGGPKGRRASSPSKPRLGAVHQEGDGPAGGDRVEAQMVAAFGGPEHRVPIGHAAERSQRVEGFIFQSHASAGRGGEDVLAADSAAGAGVFRQTSGRAEIDGGQGLGLGEVALGEVAGGKRSEAVEDEEIGDRAQPLDTSPSPGRAIGRRDSWKERSCEGRRPEGSADVLARRSPFTRFDPRTAPRPPRPACRPSWLRVAKGMRRSRRPGRSRRPDNRCRSSRGSPARRRRRAVPRVFRPGSMRTIGSVSRCPSIRMRMEGSDPTPPGPRSRRLPPASRRARSGRSKGRRRVFRSSGLKATTANLAEVVRDEPTRGLRAKTSAADGPQRIDIRPGFLGRRSRRPGRRLPGIAEGPIREWGRFRSVPSRGRSGGSGRGNRVARGHPRRIHARDRGLGRARHPANLVRMARREPRTPQDRRCIQAVCEFVILPRRRRARAGCRRRRAACRDRLGSDRH